MPQVTHWGEDAEELVAFLFGAQEVASDSEKGDSDGVGQDCDRVSPEPTAAPPSSPVLRRTEEEGAAVELMVAGMAEVAIGLEAEAEGGVGGESAAEAQGELAGTTEARVEDQAAGDDVGGGGARNCSAIATSSAIAASTTNAIPSADTLRTAAVTQPAVPPPSPLSLLLPSPGASRLEGKSRADGKALPSLLRPLGIDAGVVDTNVPRLSPTKKPHSPAGSSYRTVPHIVLSLTLTQEARTVPCHALPCGTAPHRTVRYGAVRCRAVQTAFPPHPGVYPRDC